ncbi:basement membrane-specific heparan sulfate proteoglycan core protein-like [Anneissia japonica]|uniref:basement membrane-specific heparan sulfate proteoglycan core protein-like n=1 Tax=Anneissia japonica TaxID=1529436 RepID=UPI0014256DA0|nr:basement membrane-specific heparan sulfate proteoglycan core protein-like [Anneissia japonica]
MPLCQWWTIKATKDPEMFLPVSTEPKNNTLVDKTLYFDEEKVDSKPVASLEDVLFQDEPGSGDRVFPTTPRFVIHATDQRELTTEARVTDDEDLVGSGEGSGVTTSGLSPVRYYRIMIVALNINYTSALQDYTSAAYKAVTIPLQLALDDLYRNTPGEQFSTILQYTELIGGVEILYDLGSINYFDDDVMRAVSESAVQSGSIGNLKVHPESFYFEVVIPDVGSGVTPSSIIPTIVAYFRVSFFIINYPIPAEGLVEGSTAYQQLKDEIYYEINALYSSLPGQQDIRGLKLFEENNAVKVSFDIVSVGFAESAIVRDTLYSVISTGSLNSFEVEPESLTFITVGEGETSSVPNLTTAQPSPACRGDAQFVCPDGQCVDFARVCDGFRDCSSGEDEQSCSCLIPNAFTCNTQQCIQGDLVCDGFRDCTDGSDEVGCQAPTCKATEFRCANGECRPNFERCNGNYDCADASDEDSCALPPNVCGTDQFECVYQFECVDIRYVCEGYLDCTDGSDEENCRTPTTPVILPPESTTAVPILPPVSPTIHFPCADGLATCNDGGCIQRDFICDGDRDCKDGSDEIDCTGDRCEPNEFRCNNGFCAMKIWRCDGDIDCTDGSDELNCPTGSPDDPCTAQEFQCLNSFECIPKAYRCDDQIDCVDRSDEITCAKPDVTLPPNPRTTYYVGETIIIYCEAQGIPYPQITWRLNWGSLPESDRITTTSVQGRGTLTIRDARKADQGAYTCEATNSRGSVFAIPDAIIIVIDRGTDICQSPSFNDAAEIPADCIDCFCFGVTSTCFSSGYYETQVSIPFNVPDDLFGVQLFRDNDGNLTLVSSQNVQVFSVSGFIAARELVQLPAGDYYWFLPDLFTGNKLTSYGMHLSYSFRYTYEGASDFKDDVYDVLLKSGDIVLAYKDPVPAQPQAIIDRRIPLTERCGPGYYRDASGNQYLGLCTECRNRCNGNSNDCHPETGACRNCEFNTAGNACDVCADGYYGDPLGGRPCKPCPCPLEVESNQFSRTCYMDPTDNLPTCDRCPQGYEGRQCERCSKYFVGNPMEIGSSCNLQGTFCDSDGYSSIDNNGDCVCKENVEGDKCNSCKPKTFFLGPKNPKGCISCFCMGVSTDCSSSTWSRDSLYIRFQRVGETFDITLSDPSAEDTGANLVVRPAARELSFSSFGTLPRDTFYWNLPEDFTGNKLTSYGGNLRYSIAYRAAPSGSPTLEPDVIIVGNGLRLYHYSNVTLTPDQKQSVSVPFFENAWKRPDGDPVPREIFMMAITKLNSLLIRASYSTQMTETSIQDVSLDVAYEYDTGRDLAYEVEQCVCPPAYEGLSCERCSPGFTRTGAGLYLGFCGPCDCNGHSDQCDPESGICRNCLDNTVGNYCESCAPGYYGDARQGSPSDCRPCPCPGGTSCEYNANFVVVCTNCPTGTTGDKCLECAPGFEWNGIQCVQRGPCNCDLDGSINNNCLEERGDIPRTLCPCKTFVTGDRCDQCQPKYYNLAASNPDGCLRCFCMGVTSDCNSSPYFRDRIYLTFPTSVNPVGTRLVNSDQSASYDGPFSINVAEQEIYFTQFQDLNPDTYYWKLPSKFLGDQLTAYGGSLRFTINYRIGSVGGIQSQDPEVLQLAGNDITLIYRADEVIRPGQTRIFDVPLVESSFVRPDGERATREHIMMILADLDTILIRASYHTGTVESRLRGVSMDNAVCILCECNGHSEECDPETGVCSGCRDNTFGDFCELCKPGYYQGDASVGCRQCACPLTAPSNNFSPLCELDNLNNLRCTACPEGYEGSRCERCAAGYIGSPTVLNGKCSLDQSIIEQRTIPDTIKARANQPTWGIPELGCRDNTFGDFCELCKPGYYQGDASVGCRQCACPLTAPSNNICYFSKVSYTLAWMKEGGALPQKAEALPNGDLIINNVDQSDEGVYACIGSNMFEMDKTMVSLRIRDGYEPPQVRITPAYRQITEGDTVLFVCTANGSPTPTITWTHQGFSTLPSNADISNGVLRISSASVNNAGTYQCEASNIAGSKSELATLVVIGIQLPTPTISPEFLDLHEGQTAEFTCAVSDSTAVVEWTRRDGRPLPANAALSGNTLYLQSLRPEDSGEYVCTAGNSAGYRFTTCNLIVREDFRVAPNATIIRERAVDNVLTIQQGQPYVLQCYVTGNPRPMIRWERTQGFNSNHEVSPTGAYLTIRNAQPEDRDYYSCIAENSVGYSRDYIEVDIQRRSLPEIELYPELRPVYGIGESIQFLCRVIAGDPSPQVSWSYAEGTNPSSAEIVGDVIRFRSLTSGDQGTYNCLAENIAGSVSLSLTITVQGPPQVSISPASPAEFRLGDEALLECIGTGSPIPSIHWMKMNYDTQQYTRMASHEGMTLSARQGSAMLSISSITNADAGQYMCRAENSAGYAQQELVVSVVPVDPTGKVVVTPTELRVIQGEDAEFSCTVQGAAPGSYTVMWRRVHMEMPESHGTNNGVLTIYDSLAEDSGDYYCVVGTQSGFERFVVSLIVNAPPVADVMPRTQTIVAGGTIRIQCIAKQGTSPITYKWEKDGSVLPYSATTDSYGLLTIHFVSANDTGRYICTCSNQAGTSRSYSDITVLVPPTVSVVPFSLMRAIGSSVEFNCHVTAGSPPPRITWRKDNGILPDTASVVNNNLILSNLALEDQGTYTCTAENSAGRAEATGYLTLQAPPAVEITVHTAVQFVAIGESVTFECKASGDPTPTIQWTRVDAEIPFSAQIEEGMLTIPIVQLADAGTYRCVATNVVDSVHSQVILYVQSAPQAVIQPPSRTTAVGSVVVFTCLATGYPSPRISWRKLNGDLPANRVISRGVLTINNVVKEDSGTYVCTANNTQGAVEYTAELYIGGFVPYFQQMPLSYIEYPRLSKAYEEFEIDISFKPESPNGMLLYNGQKTDGSGDFFSFGLFGGHAEFRFELGGGVAIIRSEEPLELGQWHTVTLKRSLKAGQMLVHGQNEVFGQSGGQFQGMDLLQHLYLGGVPKFGEIARNSGLKGGFVGCVSQVIIGGENIDLGGDALSQVGVTSCQVCQDSPCLNGGVCSESGTEVGYQCSCQPGFVGQNCELEAEQCYSGACGDGQCVAQEGVLGFICRCPLGKTGDRCQTEIDIVTPSFKEDSYIAFSSLPERSRYTLSIRMTFKPETEGDGILLFNGQMQDGSGDYISLYIKDRRVVFQYDSGSGAAVITGTSEVNAGQWHTLVAERNRRDGSLEVDDNEAIKGQSPAGLSGLDVRLKIFVGGVDNPQQIPSKITVTESFKGCIAEIKIGDNILDILDNVRSADIGDCSARAPCQSSPCQNNGVCTPAGLDDYYCICGSGYQGKDCELLRGPCETYPCQNGGSCVTLSEEYKCFCPMDFTGPNCELVNTFTDAVEVSRDGFIALRSDLIPRNDHDQEQLRISFKTFTPNGVILWQGVNEGKSGRQRDFIAIGIRDGYVVFTFQLGSGVATIDWRHSRVDDGVEHSAFIQRSGNQGFLSVDGNSTITGQTQGQHVRLDVPGPVYLGGAPDVARLTGGQFTMGIVGCISDLQIHSGQVNLQSEAVSGENVGPCI